MAILDNSKQVLLIFSLIHKCAETASAIRLKRFSSYSGVNCRVIHKCVEAKIIQFLRNHSTSEKGIQGAVLLQDMLLFLTMEA